MQPGKCRSWTVVVAFAVLVAIRGSQSFIFDQCGIGPDTTTRQTAGNLTAQECVGKLILDTLTKASEDPESFFKANVSWKKEQ